MKKIFLILFILLISSISAYFIFEKLFTENITLENLPHETDASLKQALLAAKVPEYFFQVETTYSHDIQSFTEGLILNNNFLYESSGLYASSKLREFDMKTGDLVKEISLDDKYFGEGIAILGDNLYLLTYKEHLGFIYNKNTLKLEKTFFYPTEGWGLTTNGSQLIMSNGSDNLIFINIHTLKAEKTLKVRAGKTSINSLNELEYIHDEIYANVWPTSIIIIISPKNGRVIGWLNLKALKPATQSEFDYAMNGIAFNNKNGTLMVTGKNWPYLYAIKILTNKNADYLLPWSTPRG